MKIAITAPVARRKFQTPVLRNINGVNTVTRSFGWAATLQRTQAQEDSRLQTAVCRG
jgi:hypothetical protein